MYPFSSRVFNYLLIFKIEIQRRGLIFEFSEKYPDEFDTCGKPSGNEKNKWYAKIYNKKQNIIKLSNFFSDYKTVQLIYTGMLDQRNKCISGEL